MLRKFLFILPLFIILNSLFASPVFADWPTDCALDYPVCRTSLPPGTPVGTCLNRDVLRCNTSSGTLGNWCCPSTFVVPTVTPTRPPVPSCIANGNYCVATNVACDPGHARGQGGSCETGKVCCAIAIPTQPPPGGPPGPIPLPTYPTNFSPLEYPCDKTTDEEFHPLRPYPASPCDPLIPAKREPYPLSFACGKSLNPQGEYTFSRVVDVNTLDPWNEQTAIPDKLYRCGTDVCTTKRSVFDITLDLSPAKLPVVGNTQDPLDDATKVNNYLSWYLAGTNPTWLDDLPQNTIPNTNTQCIGTALSTYMNTIITGTSDLENVRLTSPAFNLTNPIEQDIFISMVASGADFASIDAFAGNTYTLNGVPALDWVKSSNYRGSDGKTWYEKFTGFGKSIIFTEFGDFGTKNSPELPNPPSVISDMKAEFSKTAQDTSVKSINYFNAFGKNGSFPYHQLLDSELTDIILGPYAAKAGVNSAIGVDGSGQFHTHIEFLRAGWSVELFFSPGDLDGVVAAADQAHNHHITPIFRPCYGNNCDFANPSAYVQFIREVAQRVANKNREIWFIAGPNEPAGEPWAAPLCAQAGVPTASIDRFLTYAGPIKKLLPQSTLDIIRYVLADQKTLNVHDYKIDLDNRRISQTPGFINIIRQLDPQSLWAKLFQRVPLSTVEDTVGEVTIGLITSLRTDGSSPQPPDVYIVDPGDPKAMRLTIKSADSRLYFPHLKTVTSLIEVLNAISRPKMVQNYSPDFRNVTQPIDQHQGLAGQVPGAANDVFVETDTEYPGRTTVTRNTEVRQNAPAPPALFGQTNHLEYDQRCDLTTLQMAEGDNLFGQQITGKLTYTQKFRFTPIAAPPGQSCITQDPPCPSGNCNSCSMPENPDPSLPSVCPSAGSCAWRDGNNQRYCSTSVTTFCGTYANITGTTITLPTEARTAVFTKTPLIDAFYDNLISAKNSFFRRFVNWYPSSSPDTTIRSGSLAFPVKTQVGYSATAAIPTPPESAPDKARAGAGNNTGGPEIYFPRLGSLADYFLGGPTNERLNLQKMLRPKNFGSIIGPGGVGILAACQPYLSNFPGSIAVNVQNPKNVFSKVGDSITVSTNFLRPFAGAYNLGQHTALQPAVNFFSPTSFSRSPLSAGVGWNSADLVRNNFAVLDTEFTEHKPATAIIMIGTNDSGGPNQVNVSAYKARLIDIINYTSSRGIIPILSTLPHLTNSNPQYNTNTELLTQTIKEVSTELGVPLMDYRLATEQINTEARNWGISTDNIHPSVGGGNAGDLSDLPLSEGGYNVRNFVSLCALDAIWKTRLGGNSGSVPGDCFTAAQPVTASSCTPPGSSILKNACHVNSNLKTVIQEAANRFNTHPAVILGILSLETTNGVFGVSSAEIARHTGATGATGFTPYNCQPNSCGAMGAMQLLTTIGYTPACPNPAAATTNNWQTFGGAVVEACRASSGYAPNPGNIRDSIYAGAKMVGLMGQPITEAGVKEIGRRYFGSGTARYDRATNLSYINDCFSYTPPPGVNPSNITYGEYLWEVTRPRL